MRLLIRPRRPVLALLLLAPSIPELLTGSTPITTLFYAPASFAVSFLGIVGLYGCGALLIREFAVYFHKGWASILLLGAAYGIGEEGFAVHTFFQPGGAPVYALGTYGHLAGVNWLWALGLVEFHATYSIALPILLVGLMFPSARGVRWLDRGAVGLASAIYVGVVALFALVVGHGPTAGEFALFLALAGALIGLAWWAPADLLRLRAGPALVPSAVHSAAAALPFVVWTGILVLSGHPVVPAWTAGIALVGLDLLALFVVLRGAGSERPEATGLAVAVGMLGVLCVWDVLVEFSVPGILLVTAVYVYLLYWLRGRLRARGAFGPTGGPPRPRPT